MSSAGGGNVGVGGCTHNPEQPAFHLEDGNHVTGVNDHVRNEEGGKTESNIEVAAHQTECPKEALHSQETEVCLNERE